MRRRWLAINTMVAVTGSRMAGTCMAATANTAPTLALTSPAAHLTEFLVELSIRRG